jgi:hypothetical protein
VANAAVFQVVAKSVAATMLRDWSIDLLVRRT